MSNLGMGVMINMLRGNREEAEFLQRQVGRKIYNVRMVEDTIVILMEDGTEFSIWDQGQSCCEHRYMVCDDDLTYFVNTPLLNIQIRDAAYTVEENEEEYHSEDHEIQFLEIVTGKGVISIANHNEHNGYYGGFSIGITINEETPINTVNKDVVARHEVDAPTIAFTNTDKNYEIFRITADGELIFGENIHPQEAVDTLMDLWKKTMKNFKKQEKINQRAV